MSSQSLNLTRKPETKPGEGIGGWLGYRYGVRTTKNGTNPAKMLTTGAYCPAARWLSLWPTAQVLRLWETWGHNWRLVLP